uniref:Uncharacterized protein n=1 Tax=Arundo donax TaxID=35708 RepID=A0A0A9F141_ARUDO
MLPGANLMAAATASVALASSFVISGLKLGGAASPGGIRNIELDVPTNFIAYVAEGVQRTASSSGRPRIVTRLCRRSGRRSAAASRRTRSSWGPNAWW